MSVAVVEDQEPFAVEAVAENVRLASEWLERACCDRDVPAEQVFRLDLCLNEALANIISHGGPGALQAPVLLTLDVGRDKQGERAAVSVSDTGRDFNPLAAAAMPKAQTLADAEPGGLGLTMISGYSDHLDYERRDGRNHLTFAVRWDTPS